MSDNPTYPGVYIQELESSVHTIVGVSTSITAFIGRADKGIRNKAVTIHSFEEYVQNFGGLSKDSDMSYAVYHYFLNGGKDAVIVAINKLSNIGFERTWDEALNLIAPVGSGDVLKFVSYNPGLEGKDIAILIKANKFDPSNTIDLQVRRYDSKIDAGTITGWSNDPSLVLESFYNLSISSTKPRFVYDVIYQMSNYIRKLKSTSLTPPTDINKCLGVYTPKAADITTINNELSPSTTVDLYKSIFPDDVESRTGMYALDDVDIFNILCIPPFNYNPAKTSDIPSTIYNKALEYCHKKRAILIIDPPQAWTNKKGALNNIDAATTSGGLGVTRDKNGVIYFPRIMSSDPNDENRPREFAPCGFIAGVIARTDSERGVWKAPAGIQATIFGANDLAVKLTDPENGELNPLGINCLRLKPPAGIVVWGARTMNGADALTDQWKYLPVRRLALYIEESLYRGTQWIVFEPNDEGLWSQIRLNIGSFMHDLFTKGAFQGSNPKEAYLVKCDGETTTQYDIDRGIVNIVVGFAPLKPAEFVMIKIMQLAGQTGMEVNA